MAPLTYDEFLRVDLRVGTIIRVEPNVQARKPAYCLWVDFGEIGVRTSSAQVTDLYTEADLLGRQVVAVVNFPPRRIAGFSSECLFTGFPDDQGRVVLTAPERPLPNGARLF